MNTPLIEFWFEFASNYSYLSVMRIEREAARHEVSVQWRPFLLGPIFQSFGWTTSPFVLQPWKTEYVWRDMARQCRKYGLAWQRPSTFPAPRCCRREWRCSAPASRGWPNSAGRSCN